MYSQIEAAEEAVRTLTGANVHDLTGQDMKLCGNFIKKIQAKFSSFSTAFRKRKIHMNSVAADLTFLSVTTYEEFEQLCVSMIEEGEGEQDDVSQGEQSEEEGSMERQMSTTLSR